jgi:hypothetical protein
MATQPARIEDIMRFLDTEENANTKVASAAPAAAAPAPMQSALADVMATLGQSKVASEAAPAAPAAPTAAPVNDLVKMATEIVAIDRDGEIKHAQLVGAAMADAFVARINQWDTAAGTGADKTASEASQLEKFASENPEAYRSAVQQGYADAKSLIEKVGQDLYNQSYSREIEDIQKTATEHFVHGWTAIQQADQILTAQQAK